MVTVTGPVMDLLRARKTIAAWQLKSVYPPAPEKAGLFQAACDGESERALVQSLVSPDRLATLPDSEAAWKRICFYNPQENTIH
jgi:hypothetical protein